GELRLVSGKVCLADWIELDPPRLVFDLGRREATWGIHAYMRCLRDLIRSEHQITSYDLAIYLVQFWPKG
ncbi:hypothetical protein, partial [Micromonospora harpali]